MEKINMRSYGDKPQSFLQKVPNGLLPVIELDGRVYTESMDIMMLLEKVQCSTPPDTPCLKSTVQSHIDHMPRRPSDCDALKPWPAISRRCLKHSLLFDRELFTCHSSTTEKFYTLIQQQSFACSDQWPQ